MTITTDLPAPEVVSAPDIQPLKSGIATTEFWIVVITAGMSLAVALGWVGPDFAKKHEDLVNALALLAATIGPGLYAIARGIAKGKHAAASGALAAARVPYAPTPVIPSGPGTHRA